MARGAANLHERSGTPQQTAMGAAACPFSAQQVMQKVHRLTDN